MGKIGWLDVRVQLRVTQGFLLLHINTGEVALLAFLEV